MWLAWRTGAHYGVQKVRLGIQHAKSALAATKCVVATLSSVAVSAALVFMEIFAHLGQSTNPKLHTAVVNTHTAVLLVFKYNIEWAVSHERGEGARCYLWRELSLPTEVKGEAPLRHI